MFTPGQTGALACVEVPGYVWLLQFGCTPAGHDLNWTSGIPQLEGLSECNYTYETIEKDMMAMSILLLMYVMVAVVLYGFIVRERR